MSAQVSFPQFLKKNPVSPPRANMHTVLCSHPGFSESRCLPLRKPTLSYQMKGIYDSSRRVLSSTFVLTPKLQIGRTQNPSHRKNSGSRMGSLPGWTSEESNTGTCFHNNVSPSRQVWEGIQGHLEAHSLQVALGLERTLIT